MKLFEHTFVHVVGQDLTMNQSNSDNWSLSLSMCMHKFALFCVFELVLREAHMTLLEDLAAHAFVYFSLLQQK